MALVSYQITNGIAGDAWSGSFTVTNPANPIKTELPTSISSPNVTFTPTQFALFGDYVTWRSVDISGQPPGPPNFLNIYPRTGYSFDIWSPTLVTSINANATWQSLNLGIFSLIVKNTVIYNYDIPDALHYTVAGILEFTVT